MESSGNKNTLGVTNPAERRRNRLPTRLPVLSSFKTPIPQGYKTSSLLELFKSTCKRQGFYISESSSSAITAVYNTRSGFFKMFSCFLSEERSASVVRLSIRNSVLFIRGLQGDVNILGAVIESFKENCPLSDSQHMTSTEPNEDLPKIIFSNTRITEFLRLWQSKHSNLKHSADLLPAPVREIRRFVEDLIGHSYANRTTVEKILYTKVMSQIIGMYHLKYAEKMRTFEEKLKSVQNKNDIMNLLEIKKKFRLERIEEPYQEAIESVRLLENRQTPLDKINCLLEAFTSMKTLVVDYWKGKHELNTMDDQFPVMIYIIIQMRSSSVVPQIAFLNDYIEGDIGFDNEQKILIDLDSAISYVVMEMATN